MQENQIRGLLQAKFANADITIQGADCDFAITVVSELFKGLRTVQRQQLVYSCLQEFIQSGQLHAITMKVLTPEENNKV